MDINSDVIKFDRFSNKNLVKVKSVEGKQIKFVGDKKGATPLTPFSSSLSGI